MLASVGLFERFDAVPIGSSLVMPVLALATVCEGWYVLADEDGFPRH